MLPKGGWEKDEKTASDAAQREAWEEAGIKVEGVKALGHIADTRPPKSVTKDAPKASYQFFEAVVKEEAADWPEKNKRARAWFTFAQASVALAARPELTEAIKRSSVKR